MQLADFDFVLPEELIAQTPAVRRDASRLMLVDRSAGGIAVTGFAHFGDQLHHGDLLVLNDTRVIPARLHGQKESGGRVEVFLVRRQPGDPEIWTCLLRASKAPKPGVLINLAEGIVAEVLARVTEDTWQVVFRNCPDFTDWLNRSGNLPLPPYINRQPQAEDRERYQTVFARSPGAVAAPTAGLHLTPEILAAIQEHGIDIAYVTLHVGLGTFMPIRTENLAEHRMHREEYLIPAETVAAIDRCRERKGRVVAVGTTVVRTLEYAARATGTIAAGAGEADIFICPGFQFRVVDALLTNFHLPKSTLLMLVSAFAGKELLFQAYERAIAERFRFFSYGDAMFIQ
jgi:S-adenosylmethionine:tRNA ribosyltransferase-isomerase